MLPSPSFKNGFARYKGHSKHPKLWDGLVGAWLPSLGVQGQNLFDQSGFRNDGVLTNMTNDDWVNSENGYVLAYGTNKYVQLGQNLFENLDQGSIVIQFRVDDFSTIQEIYSHSASAADHFLRLFVFTDGTVGVNHSSTISPIHNDAVTTGNSVTVGSWNHFVLTSNGSQWEMYLNGKKEALSPLVGSNTGDWFSVLPSGTHDDRIGRLESVSVDAFFDGQIGSFSVYNRPLFLQEIAKLYQDPHAAFELRRRTLGLSTSSVMKGITKGFDASSKGFVELGAARGLTRGITELDAIKGITKGIRTRLGHS